MRKQEVRIFSARLEDELFELHHELRVGIYRHGPYEHFFVHDPKRRFISKASVKDRVVHQAVVQAIEPIFERHFIHDSYSSRKGRGIHAAVLRLETFARRASQNYRQSIWALKCDIRKFFDSVDHEILRARIGEEIDDPALLGLLREIITSYATDAGRTKGIPLGNVTSQLFANAYLDRFDHFVKEELKMQWYLRFCDDFIIVHHNREMFETALPKIAFYLDAECALCLHPKKISLRKLSHGIDFVGQALRPHYRIVRTKTKRRLFRRMRTRLEAYGRGTISQDAFRQSLQSSLGVLTHGSNTAVQEALKEDMWRRLRKSQAQSRDA